MLNQSISSVVVDNEDHSREMVQLMLGECFPSISLSGEANSVSSAVSLLENNAPDLVFLDVEMNDGTGFDVLKQLGTIDSTVVFVTSFDKYAIDAIKTSAFDYLLKPINREDFKTAVNRALKHIEGQRLTKPQAAKATLGRIALPSLTGFNLVEIKKIARCEADGNYTTVYFESGVFEKVSKTLGQIEEQLDDHFFRVHHKHLVNLSHVKAYQKGKAGGTLKMLDGSEVEVSIRRKAELLKLFS